MPGHPGIRVREAVDYILAFALGVVMVGIFLRFHISTLYQQEMVYWQMRQSSVADERAQRVSEWLADGQANAQLFATHPSVRNALRPHYDAGQPRKYPPGSLLELTTVLDEMAKWYSYAGVYILDRDAQVVAQSSRSKPLNPLFSETCRAVARSEVMRIDLVGDAPNPSLMGFSAPVFHGPGATDAGRRPGQLLGIVLLVSDVSQTLFPLVTREGVPTRTSETLLVRREGDDIVYFSPLRHVPAGSPNLRIPLSAAPRPARLALEGRETFVEYNDYRGVPVLAATGHIPLTGWGLVRKIDRAEAMEDFRRMAIAEGLAGALLVILLGGLLLFHRREVMTRVVKQVEEKFRALLESAPDAIYIIEPSTLRIVGRNRKAAEMDGYSDEDLAHMTAADLPPPEERYLLLERFGNISETGLALPVRGLHHRRKDGQLVPVEESLTVVEAGGERLVLSIVRDITERKLTEEALQNEKAFTESIIDSLPDAFYVIDSGGRNLRWNKNVEKLLGYSSEELAALDPLANIVEDERPLAASKMQEALAKGSATAEIHLLTKDGRKIPYILTATRAVIGDEVYLVGVGVDITERKRAEEALRESEQFIREIIANVREGVAVYDPEFRYLVWNRFMEGITGVPASEALGKHAFDLFPHLREQKVDLMIRRALAGEVVHAPDTPFRVPTTGKSGWVSSVYSPHFGTSGEILGVIGVCRDITERKQAEEEHTRLVTAIEQSAEAVVITDTDGNIQYVNPAFTCITGYSREEALGQNPRILKSDKHDLAFYQQLWATIREGEIWHGEVTNRGKDGSLYIEEMNIAPVRSTGGEVTHYIAIMRDITAQKRLEEQFRQVQKMEAVGRLAAGVAHDFNNLLTIINGYSELMIERLSADDPMRGSATEIRDAGQRAAGLTRQLLAFSRQQVFMPQVLDLNPLVTNLQKMLSRLVGEDIELVFIKEQALGPVRADPGQIEQVLMNLAVNSRDAMPQGGKLTIETCNAEVDETIARSHYPMPTGSYAMLAVTDTGCGMDKKTQARIFEPFFTTKDQGKGTGLGLATVYGIVKQSGGFVWVYSEPGQGATFKIYMPVVEEVPRESEVEEAAGRAGGSETVLLAEDDDKVRYLARVVLEAKGYRVLEARNGKEALLLGGQYKRPIHLLLTDVVMPGTGGRELGERLARLHRETKMLYMSGYADDTVVRHGMLESGAAFLQKPFTPEALARKVREVLDL
jgi:PAS domain S-box-containing protein